MCERNFHLLRDKCLLYKHKIGRKQAFYVTMAANAYWAFCEFMLTDSSSVETAILWEGAFLMAVSFSVHASFCACLY